jgi:hypothetical protein
MIDDLRRPLFFIAVALITLVVLVETGSSVLRGELNLEDRKFFEKEANRQLSEEVADPDERRKMVEQLVNNLKKGTDTKPPGMGIPYLALLDGLVLYTIVLMGAALLIPERIHGRVQGVATLIVSLLVLLLAIFLLVGAFLKLLIMVALFTAAPFGTIAYLAIYGFFNRRAASIALSLTMMLKLGFAGCLVFAHQRFLQNKGLVLIVLTSLVGSVIISFLHGLVPIFLVSITDAIAAIIVVILAAIWAIFLLVGSIISIVKAIA